jgi:hypothetical protein
MWKASMFVRCGTISMVACNHHINEHHCTTEKSNKFFSEEDSGLI